MIKNLPANAGDIRDFPGSGRSPGGGNGNPLQYYCLENPMDRGAMRATVHGVAEWGMTEGPTLSLSISKLLSQTQRKPSCGPREEDSRGGFWTEAGLESCSISASSRS